MTKSNAIIPINARYGFAVSEREYTLHRLITVDPTKAPGYKAEPGGAAPTTREEWRLDDRWYSLGVSGMSAMLAYVATVTVNDAEHSGVGAYLTAVKSELAALRAAIEEALK